MSGERRHTVIDSRLGDLTIVAEDDSVRGIYFELHWTHPGEHTLGEAVSGDPLIEAMGAEVDAYLDGELRWFTTSFRADGTEFERAVWAALQRIEFGATTTYGALAKACGMPGGAQAIGHVVGANPLSIVIPCHRVVGSDGSLTGYAGGLHRKRYLLDLEAYLTGQLLLDPRLS